MKSACLQVSIPTIPATLTLEDGVMDKEIEKRVVNHFQVETEFNEWFIRLLHKQQSCSERDVLRRAKRDLEECYHMIFDEVEK